MQEIIICIMYSNRAPRTEESSFASWLSNGTSAWNIVHEWKFSDFQSQFSHVYEFQKILINVIYIEMNLLSFTSNI